MKIKGCYTKCQWKFFTCRSNQTIGYFYWWPSIYWLQSTSYSNL